MELLERDAELAALHSYWTGAVTGRGRLVLLGGEAGAGKTSVMTAFAAQIRDRVLIGVCDPGTAPRPLGPLLDVAGALDVQTLLDDGTAGPASLFPQVRAALGRTPTLLLIEDLHWADEATLDLVRYLGRRTAGLSALVVGTFRDDEVTGAHPLAGILGDLATAAGVSRMQLPLLTPAAVGTLIQAAGATVDAVSLHRSTGGNPFFVSEVLAARTSSDTGLPATVRDAVTARAARLGPGARRTLDASSVVGPTAEIEMVKAVSGQPSDAVDECVRSGVLIDQGTRVSFRHEMARRAILDAMPPGTRADLHRNALAQLVATGSTDHRRLARHALGCADSAAVLAHAPLAAHESARLGAHRVAADLLRAAVGHADGRPAGSGPCCWNSFRTSAT